MTGGGFGGCTVSLVAPTAVRALETALHSNYWKQSHQRCDCYETLPAAGAGSIDLAPYLADRPFDRTAGGYGTVTGAASSAPATAVHHVVNTDSGVADGTEAGAAAEVIASGAELVVGSDLWEDIKWPLAAVLVAASAVAAFVILRKRH